MKTRVLTLVLLLAALAAVAAQNKRTVVGPKTPKTVYRFDVDRALLAAAATLSLAAVVLLVLPLARRKLPVPEPKFEETPLAKRLEVLSSNIEISAQKRAAALSEQVGTLVTREQLAAEGEAIREHVTHVGRAIQAARGSDPVTFEHQVLGEYWKQFCDNRERSAAFETALQDGAWEPLLNEFRKFVPDDLKPSFDAVAAPCREYRSLVTRVSLVPRIVSGDLPRLEGDAEEVWRTREFAGLLSSAETSKRLQFHFKNWVTDSFLSFADLYLQRHQQVQVEQGGDGMRPGVALLRQVLGIVSVEPIDVTVGETSFDSLKHIGRSTSNDPRFLDGVITGVVRNGFVERGQQVIRQPEVIVNRTR
jgi:hypothetical protein